MDIIKQKSEIGTYDFHITKDNKTLYIIFGGNGDLYWILNNNQLNLETLEEHITHFKNPYQETFIIDKENYTIYSLFEELINDIKDAKIHLPTDIEESDLFNLANDLYDEDEEEYDEYDEYEEDHHKNKQQPRKKYELPIERYDRKNAEWKNYYRYHWLYQNEVITWRSDEHIYEDADRVKIYQENENIILEFSRPPIKDEELIYHMYGSIGVRFRNSGSYYDPFNIIFMRMFNKLQEYDPDYHQIHIEELLYQKKLTRKK